MRWAYYADQALAPLFADGRSPTAKEIRDAYPFGERAYWPYKVWLRRVKWWRSGGKPVRKPAEPLPGQEALL